MNEAQEVYDLLLQILGPNSKFDLIAAIVKEVDKDENTCDVDPQNDDSDATIEAVDLCALGEGADFVIYPEVGSLVIVSKSKLSGYYVSMFSKIESIVFFKGANDGMVKINPLVQKIRTLEQNLNNHIVEFNALVTNYNAHQHTSTDVGLPTTPGTPPATGIPSVIMPINPTTKNDLENEKIKH